MAWKKVEVEKPHYCDKPYYVGEAIVVGDTIECGCGQRWKCVATDYGMQWDPFPRGVLRWEKVEA